MNVRIHDLGPVQVEVDDRTTQLGPRPQAVLAVLLMHANERVSVETLMDALWGGTGHVGSQSTLESHVWRVRQVLEPDRRQRTAPTMLVTEPGGYRLVLATDAADSLMFTHLAEQARVLLDSDPQRALRRCDEALALWRGEPFGACSDALWAAAAVAGLVETRDQVRIRRIQALLTCGELERAVVDSGALAHDLPLNEEVWGHRMVALYRAGRADEALQAFRTARDVMIDELGLEPGAQLRDLQKRILDQDEELRSQAPAASPAVRPAVNLPRRLPALIGRSTELASLVRHVAGRQLVTVVGAAGCGKTRLAIEVAREAAGSFPDGVWLVDLAAVDRSGAVPDLVAATIGLSPAPAGSVEAQLRDYMRDRRMLLLLDNCEHVAPAVYDLLMEVLGDDAAAHVLATSREPTTLPGEITWPLNPLTTPAECGPESSGALELFLARVRDADPTIDLGGPEAELAAGICDALDGLPLALELAAARVRTASLTEIASQVRSDPGDLRRVGGRSDHRRTVRQTIEWSHRLLEPDERIVHRRLSVLPGAFTRDCAARVAGFAPLSPADVPELLDSLVNRSLVATARAGEPGEESVFRQLSTVRAHAASALREAGELPDAVAARHAWLRSMLGRRPRVGHADEGGWYRALDADLATLRATLQTTLVDGSDPFACFILSRISNFWYHRGRMIEALTWLQLAVPAPTGTDPVDAAMTELSLAGVHSMRGRTDLARPLFDQALPRLEEVPEDRRADVIEHLASLALIGALHHDFALVALLGRRLESLAAGEPEFQLMADAVMCFADVTATTPQDSLEQASRLYERALADGVLLAGWICCILISSLSIEVGRPGDGLVWTQRMIDVQARLGARPEAMPVEGRALLTAATGSLSEGVALFAASQLQSRRSGIGWPAMPATRGVLDRVRTTLGPEEFEEAWRAGLTMTARQALGLG